jgi:hypothetical protein
VTVNVSTPVPMRGTVPEAGDTETSGQVSTIVTITSPGLPPTSLVMSTVWVAAAVPRWTLPKLRLPLAAIAALASRADHPSIPRPTTINTARREPRM